MAAGTTPKRTTRGQAKKTAPQAAPAPSPTAPKKVQVVAVVDPEMVEALDAFADAHHLKSRSEAVRIFLGYGRTQAERYLASQTPSKASVPARAPRTVIKRSA
jgi:hypothetical protein